MKKLLVITVSILFMLSFTAVAYATDVDISGSIRSRGEFRDNVNIFEDDMGDNSTAFDTRVRLMFTAKVAEGTMGVLELESGHNTEDDFFWGSTDGATGLYQKGNAKRDGLFIRQAYIAHEGSGLLGRPASLKVGHMLLSLGNGLFFDHSKYGDDAVILGTGLGNGNISFIYSKFDEGAFTENDDHNAYILALAYPANGANLGADVTYIDMQEGNPVDGETAHFWNLGLRGDVDVSGIKLKGDVEWQTGSTDSPGDDTDFKGYAFLVGADVEVSGIKLGAEFAYGSGEDDDDNDVDTFVTLLGDDQHYTYVYEYRTVGAAGMKNSGLSNTWYVNVGASTDLTPDLKGSLDVYYLQASEDVALGGADPDNDLGWEVDGKLTYTIDKNLVYYIEGGYLFPGDAYNLDNDTSADNAFAVRNGIMLTF